MQKIDVCEVKSTYSPRCTVNVAEMFTAIRDEANISPNSSVSFRGSTMFTFHITPTKPSKSFLVNLHLSTLPLISSLLTFVGFFIMRPSLYIAGSVTNSNMSVCPSFCCFSMPALNSKKRKVLQSTN